MVNSVKNSNIFSFYVAVNARNVNLYLLRCKEFALLSWGKNKVLIPADNM